MFRIVPPQYAIRCQQCRHGCVVRRSPWRCIIWRDCFLPWFLLVKTTTDRPWESDQAITVHQIYFLCRGKKNKEKTRGNLKDSFLRFHENFKNSLKTAVLSSNQKENSEFIFKNFWLKLRHVKQMGFLWDMAMMLKPPRLEHHSWRTDGVKWDEEKPNISRRSGDF